jgi:hypothetical protein
MCRYCSHTRRSGYSFAQVAEAMVRATESRTSCQLSRGLYSIALPVAGPQCGRSDVWFLVGAQGYHDVPAGNHDFGEVTGRADKKGTPSKPSRWGKRQFKKIST